MVNATRKESERQKNMFTCWIELIRIIIILKNDMVTLNKGNNKITERRTILQRESQNS